MVGGGGNSCSTQGLGKSRYLYYISVMYLLVPIQTRYLVDGGVGGNSCSTQGQGHRFN